MRHLAGSDVSRGPARPSLATRAVLLIGALASMALPSAVLAQGKYSWESYEERVNTANSITAYGTDMFGEQVSLQSGALSFQVTDVSLPGNNGLFVGLTRSYTVKNRQGLSSSDLLADWQVDLPRLTGTYADAWLVDSTSGARCSDIRGPAVPPTPAEWRSRFSLSDFWQGVQMELPGGGGGELLLSGASLRKPTDGNTYIWNANNGQTQLRCIPTIANGSGEGFVAVTPDGTKYTFNWMARKPVPNLREKIPSITGRPGYTLTMPLWETSLYATHVEDRHGNWVQYSYSNAWNQTVKLTGISSSDGRGLAVTYTTANPLRIHQVSDGTRTWNYGYGLDNAGRASLNSVGLPDGTSWGINFSSLTNSPINYVGAEDTRSCTTLQDPVNLDLEPVGIITSPSGAVGTFRVGMMQHGFTNVTITCHNVTITPVNNPSDDEPLFVQSYLSWSLLEKQITGPALPTMTWSYQYASDISGHYYGTSSPAVPWCRLGATCFQPICTSDSCAGTSRTLVIAPDGNKTRYVFGNSWQYNVGKLLRVENLTSTDAVVKTVTNAYDLSRTDKTYPARYGTSLRVNSDGFESEYHRPQLGASTLLDGVTFNWSANTCGSVPCLDYWARPTQVTRASALGSKVETTAFWDQESKWVLGQMQSVNVNGTKVTSAEYDPASANMLRVYGQNDLLLQTLTYNTDGTVATVKDGRNLVTTLSSWYRGVPRNVLFHDGTSQSATVNPMGWLTSTTDENSFTTGYAYDLAGRISQVTPPAGDTVAWLPTNSSFTRSNVAAYGLPAGHWRNVVTRGNYRKETYYDGLWRPRMTREYDTANEAATRRVSVTAYEPGGKVDFTSYPAADAASVSALLQGVWSDYDALGRVSSVSQDSELGLLTTFTEYLPGFQTRVTDPRGEKTVTTYQAFDQPDTSAPTYIVAPEGATTAIERDSLGRTMTLSRFGSLPGQTESANRQYVYDVHGRLCKQIEPETGTTVMDYDAAGNVAWSAAGLALPGASGAACVPDRNTAYNSGRRVDRAYDSRNRLSTLSFPDGRGNQSWTYTLDGLPSQITTLNTSAADQVVNTYAYNRLRLPTQETMINSGTYTHSFGYDASGSPSSITNGAFSVAYAPNALGQATQAGSWATGVQYFPNGAIKQFTYGNGIVHTMTQNARQLPASSVDSGGALSQEITYGHNGNVGSITDNLDSTRSKELRYDGLNRLVTARSPVFGGSGLNVFAYDALDNLRSWKLEGVKDNANYVYDASNRLAEIRNTAGNLVHQFSYDVQGNLVNKNSVGHDFDFGNRLRSVAGQESHRYDGHGRRALTYRTDGSTVVSAYTLDGQLRYRADSRKGGTTIPIYLGDDLVAEVFRNWSNGAMTSTYLHTDALGSPVAVSDQAGAVIERTNYDPYGGPIGKVVDGIGYTGHVMDPATGLTYMQQRYYDQGVGRFLSVDPVSASSINGGNFNRYWYANNNPYKFTDPDGRLACSGSLPKSDCIRPAGRLGDGRKTSCERVCLDPTSRPANGKNRHAKRDREAQEAVSEFYPDTFGAEVEYDPGLGAAGSNVGDSKIVLGPKAFHFSKGFIASVIQHESEHVMQDRQGRSRNYGPKAIQNEIDATKNQLRNAARFKLSAEEIRHIRETHEENYGELPAD